VGVLTRPEIRFRSDSFCLFALTLRTPVTFAAVSLGIAQQIGPDIHLRKYLVSMPIAGS
jgi:hypothetical protein